MSAIDGVGFSNSATIPEDLFLLNPSHQKMVTGRRNYRYLWHQFGWGGVFLTLFVAAMFALTVPSFLTEVRLATLKTAQTKGQVIDHRISRGKSTSYYLTYQFTVQSQSYTQEESISSEEYYDHRIGESIPVTYVSGDPTTSHIGENGIRWTAMLPLLVIGGFFVVFGLIMIVIQIPGFRRFRRMRRDGQLILGQLRGAGGAMIRRGSGKNRRTDYDVTIQFGFITPNGKRIDSEKMHTRNDLKKKTLPTSGTVAVLYVNDDDYMVL